MSHSKCKYDEYFLSEVNSVIVGSNLNAPCDSNKIDKDIIIRTRYDSKALNCLIWKYELISRADKLTLYLYSFAFLVVQ